MSELSQIIQAVLFAAPEALSLKILADVTNSTEADTSIAIEELRVVLSTSGLRLSSHNNTYRLVTSPLATAALTKYHTQSIRSDLSRSAIETLAIIAYKGPVTRSDVEKIRGVGSEQMIRNLLQRELIEEKGRAQSAGRPVKYSVTEVFLDSVGITQLSDLPPLVEVD